MSAATEAVRDQKSRDETVSGGLPRVDGKLRGLVGYHRPSHGGHVVRQALAGQLRRAMRVFETVPRRSSGQRVRDTHGGGYRDPLQDQSMRPGRNLSVAPLRPTSVPLRASLLFGENVQAIGPRRNVGANSEFQPGLPSDLPVHVLRFGQVQNVELREIQSLLDTQSDHRPQGQLLRGVQSLPLFRGRVHVFEEELRRDTLVALRLPAPLRPRVREIGLHFRVRLPRHLRKNVRQRRGIRQLLVPRSLRLESVRHHGEVRGKEQGMLVRASQTLSPIRMRSSRL